MANRPTTEGISFSNGSAWYYYAGWDKGYHGPFPSKEAADADHDQHTKDKHDEMAPRTDSNYQAP